MRNPLLEHAFDTIRKERRFRDDGIAVFWVGLFPRAPYRNVSYGHGSASAGADRPFHPGE